MNATARGVLLDVEGTTSAVAYVYEVMFPFARTHLADYVAAHWDDEALAPIRSMIADEADAPAAQHTPAELSAAATRLMDDDVKATGLKQLQGLVWDEGFRTGQLVAHVYDDVPPRLRAWRGEGLGIRIYSSGSIHAQRLFFGHSCAGDLLPLIDGHYDTTTGPKREPESYRKIAKDWGLPADQIVFLSDIAAELDAAAAAGMQVALVERPGNAPVPPETPWPRISTFDGLVLAAS